MSEDNGGNGFSLLGMLLLAAFSTVLWETVPLDSSRPLSKKAIDYQNHVSAKLWQDPFKAIFDDPQVKESIKQAKNQTNSEPHTLATIPECNIDHLVPHWKNQVSEIRILSVMVNIREDADSEERRRRSRYAVLSGLGEANYIPEQTTQIKYCKWEKEGGAGVKDFSEIIVPYELYKTDCKSIEKCQKVKGDKGIVLLWLNESRFQYEPLQNIVTLKKQLTEPVDARNSICEGKCDLFVLGPERSETLRNLAVSFTKSNLKIDSIESLKGIHIDFQKNNFQKSEGDY